MSKKISYIKRTASGESYSVDNVVDVLMTEAEAAKTCQNMFEKNPAAYQLEIIKGKGGLKFTVRAKNKVILLKLTPHADSKK